MLYHILFTALFLKKEIKQVIKLNEKSKIALPKTIINYYKIVFSDTTKATATLNELKNNFKTLKNQNEKLQAFKNTGKSSLTSETMIIGPILISDLNDLTEQESVLLKKKEEGLVNKVIGNKFESQLVFVFRVISTPDDIKRVMDYTDGENLKMLKIKKFLDHAKSEANIIINQKQIDKFEF